MAVNKIMIVDDVAADLANLKSIISTTGKNIISAKTGKEAIDKCISEKPDLVFMDIVMDDVDGYSACRQILRNPETESIPIIFVTSKNQKADILWAEKQGGRALISKPYTDEQILNQIKLYA